MRSVLQQVLADSPAGYWPCDEASGATVFDRSGNSRNGTIGGSVGYARTVGPHVGLDFTGGYVDFGDLSAWESHVGSSGTLTLEAWILPDDVTTTNTMLFTKGGVSSQYEYEIQIANGGTANRLSGFVFDTSGNNVLGVDAASAISVGEIYHIAFTFDRVAPLGIVYRNGTEIARSATASNSSGATGSPLRWGKRADNAGGVYNGAAAHMAVFSTALSAQRIAAHFAEGARVGMVGP